jgi:hypothetical protein
VDRAADKHTRYGVKAAAGSDSAGRFHVPPPCCDSGYSRIGKKSDHEDKVVRKLLIVNINIVIGLRLIFSHVAIFIYRLYTP